MAPHGHLPAHQKLVDPPTAKPEHQRRAFQALLDAARFIADSRPAGREIDVVYTAIHLPSPFMSEVGVFTDVEYARSFEDRLTPRQRWTPLDPEKRSIVREFGLVLPEGFVERGYHERGEDEDDQEPDGLFVYEGEVWMLRQPIDGR